jgi:hypothetical protein
VSDLEIRQAEREVSTRPNDPAAWAGLARARARAGDLAGAHAASRSALGLDPTMDCRDLLRAPRPPAFTLDPPSCRADIGGGLVALASLDDVAAVDQFTGRVQWTINRRRARPWGVLQGRLLVICEVPHAELLVLDPVTGVQIADPVTAAAVGGPAHADVRPFTLGGGQLGLHVLAGGIVELDRDLRPRARYALAGSHARRVQAIGQVIVSSGNDLGEPTAVGQVAHSTLWSLPLVPVQPLGRFLVVRSRPRTYDPELPRLGSMSLVDPVTGHVVSRLAIGVEDRIHEVDHVDVGVSSDLAAGKILCEVRDAVFAIDDLTGQACRVPKSTVPNAARTAGIGARP